MNWNELEECRLFMVRLQMKADSKEGVAILYRAFSHLIDQWDGITPGEELDLKMSEGLV